MRHIPSVVLLVLPALSIGAAGQEPPGGGPVPAAAPAQDARLPTAVQYAGTAKSPEQYALFEEVIKTLWRKQPQNPGRIQTFALDLRGPTTDADHTYLPNKQLGWVLLVEQATRIEGGWRATVSVVISDNYLKGYHGIISKQHHEVYVYRDGKLKLEYDYPDLRVLNQPGSRPKPSPDPYYVGICLNAEPSEAELRMARVAVQPKQPQKPPSEPELRLAREVRAVLRREQPQNPGRLKSFPRLEADWPTPDGKRTDHYKFEMTGWSLGIVRAQRLPGGWRATVWVTPQLKDERTGYIPRAIFNRHTEVYVFQDGKLKMESETIDPKRDWGLYGLR